MSFIIRFTLILIGATLYTIGYSQSVSNVRARVQGETVIINYDLIESEQGQEFEIRISSSKDYNKDLVQVSGDVGETTAGKNKTIYWVSGNEPGYQGFAGPLKFEIKGKVVSSPLKIYYPTGEVKQKRGKKMLVGYTGGRLNEKLKLELVRANNRNEILLGQFTNEPNQGKLRGEQKRASIVCPSCKFVNYKVPLKTIKPRKHYIRLTSMTNSSNTVKTDLPIKIKKKSPWWFRKAPLFTAIYGAYWYYTNNIDMEP